MTTNLLWNGSFTGSRLYSSNKKQRMKKIQLMSLILFVVYAVTLLNLFYKPYLFGFGRELSSRISFQPIDPLRLSQCPLRGFKCSTSDCDCSSLCKNGQPYERFVVLPGDDIVMLDETLDPGTYCIPKGLEACNQNTSIPIYSASGWFCASRNDSIWEGDHQIACQNGLARDHSKNFLFDYKLNKAVAGNVRDYYEKLPDGAYRYRCKCESLDVRGNRMVNTLAFFCSLDYCLREMTNKPTLGWDGEKCNCGVYSHKNPSDPRSHCLYESTKIKDDKYLIGIVECMTADALQRKPMYCTDKRYSFVEFSTPILLANTPTEFIAVHE
ncbi:hypothetical protein AVEN_112023-1 [Araneus ventricosus]|uniref:Uncharacterized protein n=1 Tax=Araneus ventricosus TaxID=182803 RepID=A0A4Y2QQC8_ARAVE|nr:hypothetical protein AVEN_112023-1 [Araneus ventricosus]